MFFGSFLSLLFLEYFASLLFNKYFNCHSISNLIFQYLRIIKTYRLYSCKNSVSHGSMHLVFFQWVQVMLNKEPILYDFIWKFCLGKTAKNMWFISTVNSYHSRIKLQFQENNNNNNKITFIQSCGNNL